MMEWKLLIAYLGIEDSVKKVTFTFNRPRVTSSLSSLSPLSNQEEF